MAITVDNLEVEISASAQSAVTRIRELISALEDLRTVTNKKFGDISSKIDKVTKAARPKKQEQTASDSVKDAKDGSNANKELGQSMDKAALEAQKAAGASKDYYAEIRKIINGTSKETLNLRLLSAQIKTVTDNLNKMYQAGKGEEPAAQKALLNLYDLTEQYNQLGFDTQGINWILKNGEALKDFQYNAKYASGASAIFKQALESGILEPVKKANSAVVKFGGQVGGFLAKQLRNAASGAAKLSLSIAERPFIRLGNAVTNASKSFHGLINAIGRIVFYRTIRRAIQMITGSLQEGIQNLYQYSKIVDTQFHQSMDRLATDALYVKNSFASIAGPLIDAVAPAIDVITDKLANAMSIAAEFVAGVTGQAEYSRAVKQSTEYAEAVEGIGEAAKNAKKYLLGIDELTIFDPGTEKSVPDYSSMFEQVPVSTNMLDAIDRIKESIDGIPQVVHTAWEMTGLDMVDAWKTALKSVFDLVADIKLTSKQVFTDGFGLDLLNSIFNLLGSIANIITVIADAFRIAWNDDGRGYEYVASIFTMFTDINNLLIGIADTFSAAWNNGVGVEIAKDLLDIFTGLHKIIGNLAESIRRAWEDTGLGESIWGHVLNIVRDVLDSINTMVQATAEWAAGLDFEPLFSAFDKALESLEPLVKLITDGLAWAWQNVLLPFGSWTIQEALPAVIETLGAAFDTLAAVLEFLSPVAKDFWDYILKPLGEWTGKFIIKGLQELTDLLKDLADFLRGETSFKEFIDQLSNMQRVMILIAAGVATYKFLNVLTSIATFAGTGIAMANNIRGLGLAFIALSEAIVIAAEAKYMWDANKEFNQLADEHNNATQHYIDNLVKAYELGGQEAVNAITGTNLSIEEEIARVTNEYNDMPKNLADGFVKGWNDYFGKDGRGFFAYVHDSFSGLMGGINNFLGIASPSKKFAEIGEYMVKGLEKGVSSLWGELPKLFNTNLSEIQTQISKTFNSIKTTITNIWAGIKNSTQTTLSSIGGIVGSMTNTISGAVSGIKSKLSDIVSSASNSANSVNTKMGQIMTDIAASTEKASRNLSNIQVKQYATGGTVPSGQMFIARERGPELVGRIGSQTGVANNEQIVQGIASGVSEANVELINALYMATMQIVNAVRENGGSGPDWNTAATNITRVQNRYARMSGKAVTYN